MTSTSIYTPFTYCLTFHLTGQRYYGVRYAKGCHPDQLWTSYFTSSETIKALIEEYGEDSFIFEVRKTFVTREQACSWETKFLTKINAAKHSGWLNDHNGGSNFHSTPESIQKAKDTRKKNGTKPPMKNPESVQKAKDTRKKNGTKPPMKNPATVQKAKDTRKKNGTEQYDIRIIQKRKDTLKERGIVNPATIPFLSMIHNQKTYSKNTISRWYPELKIFY